VKFGQQSRAMLAVVHAPLCCEAATKHILTRNLTLTADIGTPPALAWEVTDENTSTSHTTKYPHWQREFDAAVREGDPQTLRQRVEAAEAALFLRLQALQESAAGHERQAISDAVAALRVIQRDKLGYPEWNRR
jgi:hypothetical protein